MGLGSDKTRGDQGLPGPAFAEVKSGMAPPSQCRRNVRTNFFTVSARDQCAKHLASAFAWHPSACSSQTRAAMNDNDQSMVSQYYTVEGSIGSPGRMRAVFSQRRLTNSSRMSLWTSKRVPLLHTSPMLIHFCQVNPQQPILPQASHLRLTYRAGLLRRLTCKSLPSRLREQHYPGSRLETPTSATCLPARASQP